MTAGTPGRPPGERAVLLAVALCGILPPLNTTMIAVALPNLLRHLGAGVSGGGWLVACYLIAIAPIQPIAGKLGDRYGRVPLMLTGLGLFGLFSVGAGFSPDLPVLIVMRVLQGLSGALVFPNATGLIRELIPAERRAKAYGLFGSVIGISAAVGPPIGGGLTSALGWRSIFFVNVPVTAIAALVLLRIVGGSRGAARGVDVPAARSRADLPPFDVRGAVALALLLGGAAALALEGGRIGRAPVVVPVGAAIAVLSVVFLRRELRHPDPVLDPRLFRVRSFAAAAGGVSFGNLALYTTLLATPLLFERTTGWSDGRIGLALAVLSAPTALLSPFGGTLADRYGRRLPATLGQLVVVGGLVPLACWPSAPPWLILTCLAIAGVGGGLTGAAQQAAAVESVPPEQAGVASGIFSTSRYVGGIAGSVALAGLLDGRTGSGGFVALFAVTAVAALLSAAAGSALPRKGAAVPVAVPGR